MSRICDACNTITTIKHILLSVVIKWRKENILRKIFAFTVSEGKPTEKKSWLSEGDRYVL